MTVFSLESFSDEVATIQRHDAWLHRYNRFGAWRPMRVVNVSNERIEFVYLDMAGTSQLASSVIVTAEYLRANADLWRPAPAAESET
jgi:hypothetical protein